MAKVHATVKVSSGKNTSGTKVATYNVRVVKTNGKSRMTGKPVYRTKAQLHTRIYSNSSGERRM